MLRLSRLPRARASVDVRRTAPGHAHACFLDRARFLDPGHPAARLALRHVPGAVCPPFTIRAFPNAILHRPVEFVPANPLLATRRLRTRADADADARPGSTNVSLRFHVSKKATSKSCVVRRRLRSKMTAAIALVVARNADAVPAPERDKPTPYPPVRLVSRPHPENESLVLQGWTYLVIPDLALYKMPLPNLVQAVRKALLSLRLQATRLEASWAALPKREPPVDRPHRIVDKSRDARIRPHSSETLRKLPKHRNTYTDKPVTLPREKPKA